VSNTSVGESPFENSRRMCEKGRKTGGSSNDRREGLFLRTGGVKYGDGCDTWAERTKRKWKRRK